MLKRALITAAVVAGCAGPALGQQAPAADPAKQGAPAEVVPKEGTSGQANTGAIDKTAKEVLPDTQKPATPTTPGQPAAALGAGGEPAGDGAVSPEMVREIREMALAAERNAPKPTPPSQEAAAAAKQATEKAIEGHRQNFFASN